ncbi:MAG: nuclease [Proteobacteria bacterium]|nr:MAG: nuclease [Pseudomonadota bacterium]
MKLLKYIAVVLAFSALATVLRYYNDYQTDRNNCNLQGKVVKLADGDSIVVLDSDNVQHKVRLQGIDAPERNQPYGKTAKKFLSDRVFGKTVCVGWSKRDRYKRVVGTVWINGVDVAYQLVKAGLAWHYKRYQDEQTLYDRVRYAEAQETAEEGHLGLWSDRKPTAPWEWRKGRR